MAWFESLVSFEGCKTYVHRNTPPVKFESLVSFEGCKTLYKDKKLYGSLRVL